MEFFIKPLSADAARLANASSSGNSDRTIHHSLSFLKLPIELRFIIFEFAFTTDDTDDGELHYIGLVDARLSSKSLLLVCRQANDEAKGFYKAAAQEAKNVRTMDALLRYGEELRKDHQYCADGTWHICVITPARRWHHLRLPRSTSQHWGRFAQAVTPWYRFWDVKNWIKRWQAPTATTERKIPLPMKEQLDIILS